MTKGEILAPLSRLCFLFEMWPLVPTRGTPSAASSSHSLTGVCVEGTCERAFLDTHGKLDQKISSSGHRENWHNLCKTFPKCMFSVNFLRRFSTEAAPATRLHQKLVLQS